MRDAFYEVYDEFIELYDDYFLAAREIGKKFPKYRGTVYVFENFEEFAIYELSEGELWNLVNLDTPYAKILHLKDAIDFNSLGRDILENLDLKNVFQVGEKVFVLVDMLREVHPDAVTCIKSYTHDYRGKVCVFTKLEDFGIYEMTDGSYRDIINFDSPNIRPIHLESAIDFYELGYNILDAGLKNVIYSDGWIYVLPDLK